MKLIDSLVKRLEGKNLSEVARRASVARDHVTDIAKGRVGNMKVTTYEKLSAALDDMESPPLASCESCLSISSGEAAKCGHCGSPNLERF